MFKLVLHLIVVRFAMTSDSGDILESLNLVQPVLRASSAHFLDESCFSPLDKYYVNAKAAKESKYPWIAQVVHSRSADIPHMCTAVCIDDAIYITAARCIYTLKVKHTTIIHMSKKFEALAFVLPSNPTKQMFDDIGIIVVDKKNAKGVKWEVIQLYNAGKRTDDTFKWFAKMIDKKKIDYKVVGYALKKGIHKVRSAERKFDLRELDVVVSADLCFKILEQYRNDDGFKVPCYHSCTDAQFRKSKDNECANYLGVEGAALIDTKGKKLVGVATWGVYYSKFELPVGFSVPNSENFFQDLTCAKRIRDDNKNVNITMGYYQKLCDGKK